MFLHLCVIMFRGRLASQHASQIKWPGGLPPGGMHPRMSASRGEGVWGLYLEGLHPGGLGRAPTPEKHGIQQASGTHPTGMYSCVNSTYVSLSSWRSSATSSFFSCEFMVSSLSPSLAHLSLAPCHVWASWTSVKMFSFRPAVKINNVLNMERNWTVPKYHSTSVYTSTYISHHTVQCESAFHQVLQQSTDQQ